MTTKKSIMLWMRYLLNRGARHRKRLVCAFCCLFIYICMLMYLRELNPLRLFYDAYDANFLAVPWSEQWTHLQHYYQLNPSVFEPVFLSQLDHSHRSHFAHQSIAIVGMIRDREGTIEALLQQLENLCCFFHTAAIIIYESNSRDRTPQILESWRTRTENVCHKYHPTNSNYNHSTRIIKQLLSDPPMMEDDAFVHSRVDRYSVFRNHLLNATKHVRIAFDYFAPIDLDIYALDVKSVLLELYAASQPGDGVSVMCLNGVKHIGTMHDSLAAVQWDEKLGQPQWLWHLSAVERTNAIHQGGTRFTRMMSCFGGMAFYNYTDIVANDCTYLSTQQVLRAYPELKAYFYVNPKKGDQGGVCEHIPFNYCLHRNGKKLVIAKHAYLHYGNLDR